jgi:DNA-binding transcriptional LysR family regulator
MAQHERHARNLIDNANMPREKTKPASHLDWNLLRSFIAIYETGTLTDAAQKLGSTQPSMGRHLRELEKHAAQTLFIRKPGRLIPNTNADALYASAHGMLLAARAVEAQWNAPSATQPGVRGVVRVACSQVYAQHVVPAIIAPLLQEHTELGLELAVSDDTHNLLRRDADIAVRFFRPAQSDVIATKLGETELGLFAHKDYLARWGETKGLTLPTHMCLAGPDRAAVEPEKAVRGPLPSAPIRFRFRTDFAPAREALAINGLAINMMFVDVAKNYPDLKRILADQVVIPQEVWLCAHDELRRSAAMRLVWDCLEQGLRGYLG